MNKILIPACQPCNGEHLSQIEKRVAEAFRNGVSGAKSLDQSDLRVWWTKLGYGFRRHDMTKRADIRNPTSPPIASEDDLKQYAGLHRMLQEARGLARYEKSPSSFFVFECQHPLSLWNDFDIGFPVGWPFVGMLRYRNVAVVGACQDFGLLGILLAHPVLRAALAMPLGPTQVRAIFTWVMYRAYLLRREQVAPKFMPHRGALWMSHDLKSPSSTDITHYFRDYDTRLETAMLARLLDESDEFVASRGGIAGFLVKPNGEPRIWSGSPPGRRETAEAFPG